MMTKRKLAANSAAHLFVDAVCATVVVTSAAAGYFSVYYIYNTFAFSTQCLAGLLTDRFGHCRILGPVACVWVALCGFLPLQPVLGAVLIGLGNSLFHVAAGSEVLEQSKGKAAPLGLFVAPGALGIFSGTTFPELRLVLCCLLILCAVWLFRENSLSGLEPDQQSIKKGHTQNQLVPALLLLLAVMTRAIGGAVAGSSGQAALWMSILVVLCVFAGKSLGGILSDRFGISRLAVISIPLPALFILISDRSFAAGAAGQFLLNLSMPVTLFLIYRCLPNAPGFSFGLAASVLWPGTLIGSYISASGGIENVLILFCFGVSLFSIIFSERMISHEESN